jgi:hypothetical protein
MDVKKFLSFLLLLLNKLVVDSFFSGGWVAMSLRKNFHILRINVNNSSTDRTSYRDSSTKEINVKIGGNCGSCRRDFSLRKSPSLLVSYWRVKLNLIYEKLIKLLQKTQLRLIKNTSDVYWVIIVFILPEHFITFCCWSIVLKN